MKIALVAGEPSGDRLGAGLMAAVRARVPDVSFVGIGGPLMLAQGLESVASMDRLTMNGFLEPIRRLPDLYRVLRMIVRRCEADPPAAFVGVDFNVFNLLLERLLRRRGIATAHYVSPSVYAWRRGRVNKIARSAELLLTLYPFEPALYEGSGVEAVFVGHPLADEIPPDAGDAAHRRAARAALGLPDAGPVVAVLPGSRGSEVALMGELFFAACERIALRRPDVRFVVPCLRPEIEQMIRQLLEQHPSLNVHLYSGDGRQALTACDVALVKSGTSTLEAMLLHRPMVVSYRLGELTYKIVRRLLRTPYVALPNILQGDRLVPELLQHDATPEALASEVGEVLDKGPGDPEYLEAFRTLHATLRRGASDRAAEAVLGWLRVRGTIAGDEAGTRVG